MTGDPYIRRNRLAYGHTFVSAPPVVPVDRIERIVRGTKIVFLRRAGRARAFDGTKELKLTPDTEAEILRAWPQGDQQADPLGWWD